MNQDKFSTKRAATFINIRSESVNTARKARYFLAYRFLTLKIRDEEKVTPVASNYSNAFCVKFGSITPYNIHGKPTHVYQMEYAQKSNVKKGTL